jgi:hypothetical protein
MVDFLDYHLSTIAIPAENRPSTDRFFRYLRSVTEKLKIGIFAITVKSRQQSGIIGEFDCLKFFWQIVIFSD